MQPVQRDPLVKRVKRETRVSRDLLVLLDVQVPLVQPDSLDTRDLLAQLAKQDPPAQRAPLAKRAPLVRQVKRVQLVRQEVQVRQEILVKQVL